MQKIHCRTNIDECRRLEWPTEMPEVPQIGDRITSPTKLDHGIVVELQVTSRTWIKSRDGTWTPEIYLDMVQGRFHNMLHFLAILEYAFGRISQETLQQRTAKIMNDLCKDRMG